MFRNIQCFVCLESFRAPANTKGSLTSHLINSHGWPNCSQVSSKIKIAVYYFAARYGSQCLSILNFSHSKQEYKSKIAKLPQFSMNGLGPDDFPSDYSEKLSETKKRGLTRKWKEDSARIENDLILSLRVHQFSGMFRY